MGMIPLAGDCGQVAVTSRNFRPALLFGVFAGGRMRASQVWCFLNSLPGMMLLRPYKRPGRLDVRRKLQRPTAAEPAVVEAGHSWEMTNALTEGQYFGN